LGVIGGRRLATLCIYAFIPETEAAPPGWGESLQAVRQGLPRGEDLRPHAQ